MNQTESATSPISPRLGPIKTARLILRDWVPDDLDAFTALHRDPGVAYWLAGALSREQARAALENMMRANAERGCGMRAVCLPDGRLIGAAGLLATKPFLPFTGFEASWRLVSDCWGRGYMTEAMPPLLDDGFRRLPVDEIVTFTAESNLKSQALMRRLGFVRDAASDFDHPRLDPGHPLRRHVVFRLPRADWNARERAGMR